MRYPSYDQNNDRGSVGPRRITATQSIDGVEHHVILERGVNGCYREIEVRPQPIFTVIGRTPIPSLYLG